MGNRVCAKNNNDEIMNKKGKKGHSDAKMMSSTFFLYKIHGQPNDISNIKTRPRAVKTSGGMRQKYISEETKYFTRNKLNQ